MAEGYGISIGDWVIMGVVIVVGILFIKPIMATTKGVGNAGKATGEFVSGFSDWTGDNVAEGSVDVAQGTGDVVSDGIDFTLGGTADIIKAPGNVARDTYEGTMDTLRGL